MSAIESGKNYASRIKNLSSDPNKITLQDLQEHQDAFVTSFQEIIEENELINHDDSLTSPNAITRPLTVVTRNGQEVRSIFPQGVYELVQKLGDDMTEAAKAYNFPDHVKRLMDQQLETGELDFSEIYHAIFTEILELVLKKDERYHFIFALVLLGSGAAGYGLALSGLQHSQRQDLGKISVKDLVGEFSRRINTPTGKMPVYCPFTGIATFILNDGLNFIRQAHIDDKPMNQGLSHTPRLDGYDYLSE